MCQAFEGEQRYLLSQERRQIRAEWEKHKSGEKVLTEDELRSLAIRKLMLDDAGA